MKKFSFLVACYLLPFICFAQPISNPFMVFGLYTPAGYSGWKGAPIIATANPQNLSNWTVATVNVKDDAQVYDSVQHFSCNKNICLAVGLKGGPLISQDYGLSWTPSTTFPEYSTQRVKCSDDDFCLVNGYGTIYKTSNAGATWKKVFTSGAALDIDCGKDFCVLANSDSGSLDMSVSYSDDKGETWQKSKLDIFPDSRTIEISSLSCADNMCVLVGNYDNGSTSLPFLMTSTDKGVSWSQKNMAGLNNNAESLKRVTCSSSYCVAIGESKDSKPFIISSHEGQTWSLASVTDFPEAKNPWLENLSCSGSTCTIVGLMDNDQSVCGFGKKPLALVSNDEGRTWISSQSFSGLNKYTHFSYEYLKSDPLQCRGTDCVLAASFVPHCSRITPNSKEHHWSPALFVSHDNGKAWTMMTNFKGMPAMKSGRWESATAQ